MEHSVAAAFLSIAGRADKAVVTWDEHQDIAAAELSLVAIEATIRDLRFRLSHERRSKIREAA